MKTKVIKTIVLAVIAGLLAACAGSPAVHVDQNPGLMPLHGSSLDGVSAQFSDDAVTLTIQQVAPAGLFVRIPTGGSGVAGKLLAPGAEDDLLHLAVATPAGADIGIVPLAGYSGEPVSLVLELDSSKAASIPPVGEGNQITDLSVSDAGGGSVLLEWTQVNLGDYDLNGEVNVADLQPIALNFSQTYDPLAAGAMDNPLFWIDGDNNGEINPSDIQAIATHYTSVVAGYNIRHNGSLLPGDPTVPAASGTPRDDLSPVYAETFPGSVGDEWVVAPVDNEGIEGADSAGGLGPVDLLANIVIDGQLLLDLLTGQNPGAFGPGKIGSRVIENIEEVDSAEIGSVIAKPTPGQFEVRALPGQQLVYFQVYYIPEVDMSTGNPRNPASVRSASAVPGEAVLTTIPVPLPADGLGPVELTGTIELGMPNPAGGYYGVLDYTATIPGDDPATPEVETSFIRDDSVRVDFNQGLVASDTDRNGDFEDEPHLEDDDKDCYSHRRGEQDHDDDEYDDELELEIEGIVSAFDEASGMITLTGAVLEVGDLETPLPDPLVLYFAENTQFEEKVRTDEDDIERDIDPSTIIPGDEVEVELYRLDDSTGQLPEKYWIEKIDRRIDERT